MDAAGRILELEKYDAFANQSRLSLLVQLGRYKEAIENGERCIHLNIGRENPGFNELWMGMAFAGMEEYGPQRYEAALQWFETSLQLQPTSQAWLHHGMALANLGKVQSALESYQKARDLTTGEDKDQIDLAIGFAYLQMENYPGGAREFDAMLARGSEDPLAYFGFGLALVLTGNEEQSIQWFQGFLQRAGPEHQDYAGQTKTILKHLGGSDDIE